MSKITRISFPFVIVFALAATCFVAPGVGHAADKDILLGVFTVSESNWSDNIYASYDGESFQHISTAIKQTRKDHVASISANGSPHYPQMCPSIIYHNGYFWMLSNMRWEAGRVWPMVSYSKDLVHWTQPEGSPVGIKLDAYPTKDGKPLKDFDTVAPAWFVSKNGGIYMVFSCGYYGAHHRQLFKDQMQAYICKVTSLKGSIGAQDGNTGYYCPQGFSWSFTTARKLPFTNYKNANFIDGSLFTDNGTDYLVIKKNGLTNQLYKTTNIDNPKAWKLVNKNMTWGFEGASLAKLNGSYLLYADGVLGTMPLGIQMVRSKSLTKTSSWGALHHPSFVTTSGGFFGARHGSVLTLKAGTPEWQVAKKLLGRKMSTKAGKGIYWMVNKKTGENLYTASVREAYTLWAKGKWKSNGILWHAPESGKPVYRLVNLKTNDHHYTMSVNERNTLVKRGTWRSDFSGKPVFYSGGKKPIWRHWSKQRWAKGQAGTHRFTINAKNISGWKNEGVKLYALSYK